MHKILLLLFLIFLSACDSSRDAKYAGFWFPYKPDMHQGNAVQAEDKNKLTIGLYKQQVKELLGTPLLVDDFNQNHWIYLEMKKIKGGSMQKQQFNLYFKDDKLSVIEP